MTDRNGDTIIIHYKNIDDKTETNTEPTDEQSNQQPNEAQTSTQPQHYHEGLNDEAQKKIIETFLTGSDCLIGVC